jgi:hypothetical protein
MQFLLGLGINFLFQNTACAYRKSFRVLGQKKIPPFSTNDIFFSPWSHTSVCHFDRAQRGRSRQFSKFFFDCSRPESALIEQPRPEPRLNVRVKRLRMCVACVSNSIKKLKIVFIVSFVKTIL